MEVKRIDDVRPKAEDIVTLKKAGTVAEIRYMRSTAGTPIQKLDADHGLDMRTGEIVEYHHNESRIGDKASVRQSLKRLRDLINANTEDPETVLWVTLTYRENMTDTKRLYEDFHAYWKRLCRYLKKCGYLKAEYIAAAEPQGRGAWHLHCLFLFPEKAPFIPNAEMAEIWGQGFTKTKSLRGVTNPGLYLTAYLGDMELTEAIQAGTYREGRLAETTGKSKAVIKGARLKLYPAGFNICRSSRGVRRPEIRQTTEEKAQTEIAGMTITYEKTVSITDESGTLRNIINYRTYSRVAEQGNDAKAVVTQEETGNAGSRERAPNKSHE